MRLGDMLHAIPIGMVEEVLPALTLEPISGCSSFVRGVVFIRGEVIPVVSAAQRLGVQDHEIPDEFNIVCLRIDGRVVGVEFDEVIDLVPIQHARLLPANKLGARSGFFSGVIDHQGVIIRILDPEKLIREEDIVELDRVATRR
ncbi:chemotaxis protein CheW [Bremerella sp.]|uniref:chemotaxis protein CheW n=1 Tax=Bremerella sp. TaxID=2795602 RepID=UPI00391CF03C